MYQNVTLRTLVSADDTVKHVCIAVYDVTYTATHKQALSSANRQFEPLGKTDALTELHNRGSLGKALGIIFFRVSEKVEKHAFLSKV